MADQSPMSWASQGSTVDFDEDHYDDPRRLFNATIADITFGASSDTAVVVESKKSVYELIKNGPTAVTGRGRSHVRWIHLPANNMAWVEELMSSLHDEPTAVANRERDESSTSFNGVLRDDLWKKSLHGRQASTIHSRFMMPFATHYSPFDPESCESDDGDVDWFNKAHAVVLYMPYLHWESYKPWKSRQERIARLKRLENAGSGKACDCLRGLTPGLSDPDSDARRNEAMLHKYLHDKESPLHDRRTLDQSYFYNLRNVAFRDVDQVIGQHTWNKTEEGNETRKMMMVDQLWMWIVDRRTVITAFPDTELVLDDDNNSIGANVLSQVLDILPKAVPQGSVKSVNSLAALIIDECTGVFHRSDIDADLAFFEFFADEIGEIKAEIDRMYSEFRTTSEAVEHLWFDDSISFVQMSRKLTDMFSIGSQIAKIEEVEKIISDLDKIDYLLSVQQAVVQDFVKCGRPAHNPSRNSRSLIELSEIIETRRNSWSGMNETAKNLRKSLHSLLDLKQRQAAVSEARTARNQIAISAKQGQSVMILTIFTVLLLPVSVIAAIFGMNATEFEDGGKISVATICGITIPISITLLLLVLLFAFSDEVRKLANNIYKSTVPDKVIVRWKSRSRQSDAKV